MHQLNAIKVINLEVVVPTVPKNRATVGNFLKHILLIQSLYRKINENNTFIKKESMGNIFFFFFVC